MLPSVTFSQLLLLRKQMHLLISPVSLHPGLLSASVVPVWSGGVPTLTLGGPLPVDTDYERVRPTSSQFPDKIWAVAMLPLGGVSLSLPEDTAALTVHVA